MKAQTDSTTQEVNKSEPHTPDGIGAVSELGDSSPQPNGMPQAAAATIPPAEPLSEGILGPELPFDQQAAGAREASIQTDHRREVTIWIGAGSPMTYSIDDDVQFLEMETDVSHAYDPRTAAVAKEVRDVVAATIGRALRDVELKAVLWLDKTKTQARPMWCIRFSAAGITSEVLQSVEANLRSFLDLGASDPDALWTKAAADLLPGTAAATPIAKAAKDLRKFAGGKAIAPYGQISSLDFKSVIELPQRIGAGPKGKGQPEDPEEVGEVMGYNRAKRTIHFLIEGRQECTDISMDMAVFRDVVRRLADIDGNRCGIWYRVTWENGKVSKTELRKIQQIQGELFAQVADFSEAELPEGACA